MVVANDTGRSGASLQGSFLTQSNGTFKPPDISETIEFFDMVYRTMNVSKLDHINDICDEMARRAADWRR